MPGSSSGGRAYRMGHRSRGNTREIRCRECGTRIWARYSSNPLSPTHGSNRYNEAAHQGRFYLPRSEISAGLIAAYRATEYRVEPETGSDSESGPGSSRALILLIDQYSKPLSRLFAASGHQCAAFITACNPFSVSQSCEANDAVCARLRYALIRRAAHPEQIIKGESRDPSGAWPEEKSFLALGLDLETSQLLGREFGQNAIVWAGADAIPRLILLR